MFLNGLLFSKISLVAEMGPNFFPALSICLHISFREWQLEELIDCPDFFYLYKGKFLQLQDWLTVSLQHWTYFLLFSGPETGH